MPKSRFARPFSVCVWRYFRVFSLNCPSLSTYGKRVRRPLFLAPRDREDGEPAVQVPDRTHVVRLQHFTRCLDAQITEKKKKRTNCANLLGDLGEWAQPAKSIPSLWRIARIRESGLQRADLCLQPQLCILDRSMTRESCFPAARALAVQKLCNVSLHCSTSCGFIEPHYSVVFQTRTDITVGSYAFIGRRVFFFLFSLVMRSWENSERRQEKRYFLSSSEHSALSRIGCADLRR